MDFIYHSKCILLTIVIHLHKNDLCTLINMTLIIFLIIEILNQSKKFVSFIHYFLDDQNI